MEEHARVMHTVTTHTEGYVLSCVAAMCPERTLVDAVGAVAGEGARQPVASPGSWLGGRPWRADCLALLATWGRHRTHCTRCARSVQTCGAKSEVEARCARAPSRCAAQPLTNRPATPRATVRLHREGTASTTAPNARLAWARPADGRFVTGRERSGAGQARAARINF